VEVAGTVCVVTGAAHGIGAALVERLVADGARAVVLVDQDGPGGQLLADRLRAEHPAIDVAAEAADVADPAAVAALVARVEGAYGRIDLFVANAGIGGGGGLDAGDEVWQACWDVNVMAHVHAARAVVPGMVARGGGWFVTTASAAGLLTNLGNAPYSVTKHAAVAFAEWLSITYGDEGIGVACICPMGVETALLREGQGRLEGASVTASRVLSPAEAADAVVEGLRAERFLVLTHPEVAEFWRSKAADPDRWLAGMRRFQAAVRTRLAEAQQAE
jgi:NAD(P)-dependent dehydrogenase (short-subunit alcohol dehydrogenase family)